MKNIVIIGAGDLGREVVWLIEDINKQHPTYVILGFLDDDAVKHRKDYYGYRVLGGQEQLEELCDKYPLSAVLAMQDGETRRSIVEKHPDFDRWESIIHPSAVVAASSTIGMGSILFPHVTVSIDTKLGNFGLYYIHTTICNDCVVGDYVSVMTGAAVLEHAQLGDECFLAAGSIVHPHQTLESRSRAEVGIAISGDKKSDCEDKTDE